MPEFFSIETARIIVNKVLSPVIYTPSSHSARCPLCGSWGTLSGRNVKRLSDGRVKRYHDCPDCGFHYSSIEEK